MSSAPNSQRMKPEFMSTSYLIELARKAAKDATGFAPQHEKDHLCSMLADRLQELSAGPAERDAVLEEAIKSFEDYSEHGPDANGWNCKDYANTIRALKNAAPQGQDMVSGSGPECSPARASSEAGAERVCPECGIDLTGGKVYDCCIGTCPSQSATSCSPGDTNG